MWGFCLRLDGVSLSTAGRAKGQIRGGDSTHLACLPAHTVHPLCMACNSCSAKAPTLVDLVFAGDLEICHVACSLPLSLARAATTKQDIGNRNRALEFRLAHVGRDVR